MPQVPGLVPTAQPSGFASEVNLPVPVDAFGGAVGHALEGLGGQVEKASNEIWQQAMNMQGLQNETEAKEADAKYMMQSGLLHADFINKEGMNAGPQALAKHIQDLQDLRVNIRNGLSNPAAQRMYDASSIGFMGRNIFNAAGHSGQQVKVAANNADSARKDLLSNNIDIDPDNDNDFNAAVQGVKDANLSTAERMGWPKEQLTATNQNDISKLVSKRITGWSDTNAMKAQRQLDNAVKAGVINESDRLRVQNHIDSKFVDQGARYYSDKALANRRQGDDMNKTEKDFVDQAVGEATKAFPDKPKLIGAVRDRTEAQYRNQRSIERDQEYQDYNTVLSAAIEPNKEGLKPTSVEQMFAVDPAAKRAWDNIKDERKRQSIYNQLKTNASGDRITWSSNDGAPLRRYHELLGMANDDPSKFIGMDMAAEKMPDGGKKELVRLQNQKTMRAESDPRVEQAMKVLGRDPEYAGINKKTDIDAYYNFVGALQDSLASFQNQNKRMPKDDEIKQMGNTLIQQVATDRNPIRKFFSPDEKLYNVQVPDADATRIAKDQSWAAHGFINGPTKQQIHNFYVREQFNKLFKGSAGASEKAIVPGTVSGPKAAPVSE